MNSNAAPAQAAAAGVRTPALRWPLPALAAWALAWALYLGLRRFGVPDAVAALGGTAAAGGLALGNVGAWRRALVAAGFPLSLLAAGVALPEWAWLLPLALLAVLYPAGSWRDAPLFPTPLQALQSLPAQVALPPGARVLDAGCGLGHGLRALAQAFPLARLEGIESSWPLALACRLRCRAARVRHGDMWRDDWSGYALVYLFQRPETLPRALAKAQAEMSPGTWLASLEFAAAGRQPNAVLPAGGSRKLWLYRVPPRAAARSSHAGPGR
jgi:hypothetical protein